MPTTDIFILRLRIPESEYLRIALNRFLTDFTELIRQDQGKQEVRDLAFR